MKIGDRVRFKHPVDRFPHFTSRTAQKASGFLCTVQSGGTSNYGRLKLPYGVAPTGG